MLGLGVFSVGFVGIFFCVFAGYFGPVWSPGVWQGPHAKLVFAMEICKGAAGGCRFFLEAAALGNDNTRPPNAWLSTDKPGASSSVPDGAFRGTHLGFL